MTTAIQYIDRDKPPDIPREVAICPICAAGLIIDDIDEWEPATGRVTEAGLHITCSTQTDDKNWWNWHYQMPYVDWLPVEKVVFRWFDENFRLAKERGARRR